MSRPKVVAQTLTAERRSQLGRRAQLIAGAAVTYNVVEAVVAITAGAAAGSVALVGFGLDSIVEVLSAGAIAWQFAGGRPHAEREHVALRVVAGSFFALAAFVTLDALRSLTGAAEPQHSTPGIVLAAVSLAVMPGLSWFERRTGRELGSASVVADSSQTMICAALSGVLLVGPPGTGKTLLARRLATIMPALTPAESLETTRIYSAMGLLRAGQPLMATRPFRHPHHSVSDAGLVGGGSTPQPGEISLAHKGVLFIDELPEFNRKTLEVLRQPLEEGMVTISRALRSTTFPAEFVLVAAMNPCPCGYRRFSLLAA